MDLRADAPEHRRRRTMKLDAVSKFSLLDRIRQTIARHDMFKRGMKVGVAVSGGADSVCLLHVLCELDLRLYVLHLNHNLRGADSQSDAEFVKMMSGSLGLPCTIAEARFDVAGNLEQQAREARLALFRQSIASDLVERVALGHTRSDQAETVLFRFLRGSGTAGLSGIRPVTAGGIVRPLIEVDRAEVEQFLRDRGIRWREDASNADRNFARNRIRHDLLPQLGREWNPAIRQCLAQTAQWAQDEESYWGVEIERLSAGLFTRGNGFVSLKTGLLLAFPTAVRRRLLRRAIELAKGDLRGIEFGHINTVLDLASRPIGHGRVRAPGIEILRSLDWLRFAILPEPQPYRLPVAIPGKLPIPGTTVSICLDLIEKPETSVLSDYVYNEGMDGLDWPSLSGPLAVRNWQPGDRYHPTGSTGEKKIKTLFQRARIPFWERRQWPVLLDGESIVWVRRFGPAAAVAANSGSTSILRVQEVEGN